MAARNPTNWTKWLDEEALFSTEKIIETVPDQFYDDLEFTLDASQMVVSDCFVPHGPVTSGTFDDFAHYPIQNKDRCDESGVTTQDVKFSAYVRASTGDVGLVKVTGSSGNSSTTFSNTSWAWTSLIAFPGQSTGVDIDYILSVRRQSGSGSGVFVAGLIIVADAN